MFKNNYQQARVCAKGVLRLPRAFAFQLFFAITFVFSVAMLSLLSTTAQAEQIDVSDKVSVSFSGMAPGQLANTYDTNVVVTNTSTSGILLPIRIVITNIDQDDISVANADGLTLDDEPYIEISLPGGVLSAGASTSPAVLSFIYAAGINNVELGDHPIIYFDHSVLSVVQIAPQTPRSYPYALTPSTGFVDVTFKIDVLADEGATIGDVWLRNLTRGMQLLVNDSGINGDVAAGDGIYGRRLAIHTNALEAGDCLTFVSATEVDGHEIVSDEYDLCATSYPTRFHHSNISSHIEFNGGDAIGDEILITFHDGVSESQINALLGDIQGSVTGTSLPNNLFMIQFSDAMTEQELTDIIDIVNHSKYVLSAGANYIGRYDSAPDDTQFENQHALQLVRADDVWDINATGRGEKVILLDSGVEVVHPDFVNSDGTSQIVRPAVLRFSNQDIDGHGTKMAGIIAAATNNGIGVAGIARDAQIESIKVSPTRTVTQAQMIQGFTDARLLGTGRIVNASFSIFGPLLPTAGMCRSINRLISRGTVVVNSAGNNNNGTTGVWPAFCNRRALDSLLNAQLSGDVISKRNKRRFIVVGASNCSSGECASDNKKRSSNFGSWIDVAAPGTSVETTTLGGIYATSGNTSAAAAITSGAVAIMRSCGMWVGDIEKNFKLGATVAVTSDFNRLDIYAAMESANAAPTGVGLSNDLVDENVNTAGGFSIGILTAADTNTCDKHTYTITGGADAGSFSIGGADNNELMLDAGVLDFEAKPSYEVIVQSTDFFGSSTSQSFTINVNDLIDQVIIP